MLPCTGALLRSHPWWSHYWRLTVLLLDFCYTAGLLMVICCCWTLIVWQFVITLFTPSKSRARQALAFLNCVWFLWSAHTKLLLRDYESRSFHWMRCLECPKSLTNLSYNSASCTPINLLLWVLSSVLISAQAKLLQLAWHRSCVVHNHVCNLWYSLVVLCSVTFWWQSHACNCALTQTCPTMLYISALHEMYVPGNQEWNWKWWHPIPP